MTKLFLISGLGADTRLYNHIDIPATYDVIPVDWIIPHSTDTLETYAQKIIIQYNITSGSIVIGASLGGMIAIEIAKKVRLNKAILVSSIKTIYEAPGYFDLFRFLPVYKIFPGKLFTSLGFLIKPMFGKMSAEDIWLFNDMLKNNSPVFIKWAMGAALNWKNKTVPPNTYHIHGDRDMVFPHKNIKNAEIIKGSHIMIFNKAKLINKHLKAILKK